MAREQRKLAAILAADVVGYSRLMGRDESKRDEGNGNLGSGPQQLVSADVAGYSRQTARW